MSEGEKSGLGIPKEKINYPANLEQAHGLFKVDLPRACPAAGLANDTVISFYKLSKHRMTPKEYHGDLLMELTYVEATGS